jgi:hypothetical protein
MRSGAEVPKLGSKKKLFWRKPFIPDTVKVVDHFLDNNGLSNCHPDRSLNGQSQGGSEGE